MKTIMKRRSFLGRAAAWLCAVPVALLRKPSPAAGNVSRRPRAVHGFVTFSRGYGPGPSMLTKTNAHYWLSDVQQLVLHDGEERLRLVDCAERYLPFAQVWVVSYVDDECRVVLQAFWDADVTFWTYYPDSDTMVIASKKVQKQREDYEARTT